MGQHFCCQPGFRVTSGKEAARLFLTARGRALIRILYLCIFYFSGRLWLIWLWAEGVLIGEHWKCMVHCPYFEALRRLSSNMLFVPTSESWFHEYPEPLWLSYLGSPLSWLYLHKCFLFNWWLVGVFTRNGRTGLFFFFFFPQETWILEIIIFCFFQMDSEQF